MSKLRPFFIVVLLVVVATICSSCARHQSEQSTGGDSEQDSFGAELSKSNMVKTINDICTEPRPIGSKQIENVEKYLIRSFEKFGYSDIVSQSFLYNDENNEKSIRRTSQTNTYLAPTADDKNADGKGTNIIVKKASEAQTEKTLIISAHYDSTDNSCGANDNGSGIAIVLELARCLKDVKLPYNVEFVMFSGEEKMMLGSRYFLYNLSDEERKNILGVINIDSVGEKSNLGYMIMINGDKKLKNNNYTEEDFEKLAEINKNEMSNLFETNDRFSLEIAINSDHYPFSLLSIPAISIVQYWSEGINANSSLDMQTSIDENRLIEVAKHVLNALIKLSNQYQESSQ